MAVQFVIGRAGSGKTRHCVHAILAGLRADPLGKPVYWILPQQATFQAERALTCAAGAFCRARVVSFEQLGREMFAYAGGNVIPEVTPLGRQMVIGHLLRQLKPRLQFFASSARQPGLAVELDAAFAEFERSGKTAAELGTLIDEIELARPTDVDNVSLLAKLRDLRLVYDAYAQYLGQERLDPHQRLKQVLGCLDGCPPLRGATVYADGFTEFSDFERRLLAGLAKVAARVEITLSLDPASEVLRNPHTLPDEGSLFHQTEQAYRRLWFALAEEHVAVEPPMLFTHVHRFAAPVLATLEREMFSEPATEDEPPSFVDPPPPATTSDPVRFVLAPHRAAEVDAAARAIRALWREGYRLRDIAVIVRDVEPYHALIDASFREHGIAYFVDRRRSAAHHPLLQFVRSFFQIARYEWPNEAVLALMKSGLAGLSPAEADEVEHYVEQHRIRGLAWESPQAWTYRRRITRDEDDVGTPARPETVDAVRRRVADRVRPSASLLRLNESLTVREIATELFTVLDRFGVRETLAAWADAAHATGEPEQAAEHEQVWAEFVDLAEQMVDLLGEERVTLADFVDVLESGLERFDLALTPPTVDQVLVGQVDRTRTPELRAAFVLGLNEGEFPRVSREPSVLTEPERKELRRRHVELDADRRRQLHDEDFLGYVAFTRASQRLILSRPRADDDGRPANPSRFWQRLRELAPDAPLVEVPQDTREDTRFLETPRQVLVGLMRWTRTNGTDPPTAVAAMPASPSPAHPPLEATQASQLREMHGSRAEIRNPHSAIRNRAPWPALYQWLATYPCRDDAIDRMRHLAWRAIGYANQAALSADIAAQLFKTPLEASARQIETFATCPFKHYLRYGLGLAGRGATGVSAMDLSQVYHQVLDIVVKEALERNAEWQELGRVVTPEMIHGYAQAVGQTLRGELMLSTARNKYLLGRVERTLGEVVASQAEMMRRGQFRPGFTSVGFGEKGPLPALRVTTPGGREAVLRGSIDRVDVPPAGDHVAVFDYKLSTGALSMQDVYYGTSLQLLTYLLVLQANGEELAGRPLTPVAAFYLPLVRRLGDVKHPDEALDPASPRFHLRAKPRGVFDAEYLDALDASLENASYSDVVAAYKNKDGQLGRRNASDAADPAEFAALLGFVHRRLGELADRIVTGDVEVAPYYINRQTPCPRCDYRSVCRFETSVNRYAVRDGMGREDALRRIVDDHE